MHGQIQQVIIHNCKVTTHLMILMTIMIPISSFMFVLNTIIKLFTIYLQLTYKTANAVRLNIYAILNLSQRISHNELDLYLIQLSVNVIILQK